MMDMSVSLLVGKIVPAVAALPALAPVRQSFYNVCFYESITLYNLNIWNLCLSKYIKILKMKKKWAALLQDSKFCRPHFLAFYEILILEFLYDILQLLILCQSVSSVAQSCPTLCSPMNRSTPGLPVHHKLPNPYESSTQKKNIVMKFNSHRKKKFLKVNKRKAYKFI